MDNIFEALTVTDVVGVLTVTVEKGSRVSIDNRKYNGLAICTEGRIVYSCEGREYLLLKDHAVILPQGSSYSFRGEEGGAFPLIEFECVGHPFDSHMIIPLGSSEPYLREHSRMGELLLFGGNRLLLISKLYGLLHRMGAPREASILAPAMKYIEENYSDPDLDNGVLAKTCGISEVWFRKLFADRYGVPPHKFLVELRIGRARRLLSEGRLKISAVSELCGFSSPYHFCRAFRAHTGLTPTEYMAQNRAYAHTGVFQI
jgi:AraC-like DNA-binding protein